MSTVPAFDPADHHLRADSGNPSSDVESSPSTSISRASATRFLDASQTSSPEQRKQATSRTHLATRFLRKSASADSCVGQRCPTTSAALADILQRDDASPSPNEPNSPQAERTDVRVLSSPPSVMSLSGYLKSKVSRRRGASNPNATDNETSAQEDSDFDRSASASGTMKGRVRARLLSLKASKPSGSVSDANDAPRLPTRGASASVSNPSSSQPTTPKSSRKSTMASVVPDQPVAKKETTRARSHSVGPPSRSSVSKTVKRFSFGNQTPRPEILDEISIAVIGAPGCGKSTFVRKGWKRHDLSSPESLASTLRIGDTAQNISYTRRTTQFLTGLNTKTKLTVYEYNSRDWKIDSDSFPIWPTDLPRADGVFVCYDGSDRASFADVVKLVAGFKSSSIPTLVIACKADLEKRLPPEDAVLAINPYSKLTEVSCNSDEGKRLMRKAVDWLVKRVVTSRSPSQVMNFSDAEQQNISHVGLPSHKSERTKHLTLTVQTSVPKPPIDLASPGSPPLPSVGPSPSSHSKPSTSFSARRSPTKASSMNDMRVGHQRLRVSSPYESDKENAMRKSVTSSFSFVTKSSESFVDVLPASPTPKRFSNVMENVAIVPVSATLPDRERQKTRMPPTPWATLDELLEKVFFLAISGDDPSFISHFFLTYRRFATPRAVLLGMQKRLNELRRPSSDMVLACFAQMRICDLLEQWMREYPSDFAVEGTHGALDAVIRHVLSYSHTLSYGCDFLPFMDKLGSLRDEDASWGLKADVRSVSDSDNEADNMFDTDLGGLDAEESPQPVSMSPKPNRKSTSDPPPGSPRSSNRERHSSLPFSTMMRMKMNALTGSDEPSGPSPKEIISKLQRTAAALYNYEADSIASEITRRELQLFLSIKPRDCLRHTLTPGKKDPSTDPIARFNAYYNDLHEWVVSLILCHDKPKGRARQIEKFAEVATKLRMLNNYSGLRAVITAINQSTYPGDASMEIFKTKVDLHKKYLSSDILLRTTGAHQSYRMALRNTKGPCIPSLEVHTSDLRRANEGNPDTKPDDPAKINWAKYTMMGRFIELITSIQDRCVGRNGYNFAENKYLGQLFDVPVMDYEMQLNRIAQPADDDAFSSPPSISTSVGGGHSKEGTYLNFDYLYVDSFLAFNAVAAFLGNNDDGPPGKDSPYIYGFAKHLATDLGWDVKVVIPSTQKSWIGKAYYIKEITKGRYYYPRHPDGRGEISLVSRSLDPVKEEFAEWVLLDATPATCANIALNNLYKDSIDLVISGPNLGRNSSAAFALSSGTIGAALSSSLSHCRAIALSYGTVERPVPPQLFDPAHRLSSRIIQTLLSSWGTDQGGLRNREVDLYNVNIPMLHSLLSEEGMPVVWTTVWRNAYGRLFKPHTLGLADGDVLPPGGPDARLSSNNGNSAESKIEVPQAGSSSREKPVSSSENFDDPIEQDGHAPELVFKFAPDMSGLIGSRVVAPVGSDTWAIERGWASVTPLRASFAEAPVAENGEETLESALTDLGDGVRLFKMRL
ncbi:hypothetical protein ACEPAF_3668 [Sanghuangporus sanghuang]